MSDVFIGGAPKSPALPPHTLLPTPGGGIDWGFISSDVELESGGRVKSGPIRLFQGRHDGPNRGFGKVHIEAEHSKEFEFCGLETFILEAVSTFTEIYAQDNKRVVTFRQGKSRIQAVLEYRTQSTGKFYSIVTIFRPSPTKKIRGDIVWKRK